MSSIPFTVINWPHLKKSETKGEKGFSLSQLWEQQGLRIRIVEHSPGYLADHWCAKGHIVYVLEGEFTVALKTGEQHVLKKDMSFVASDDMSSHQSSTEKGVKFLIIDGDFLKKGEHR